MVAISKGYRGVLRILDYSTPGLTQSHSQTMDAVCLAHKWYSQIICNSKPKKQTRNKKPKEGKQ